MGKAFCCVLPQQVLMLFAPQLLALFEVCAHPLHSTQRFSANPARLAHTQPIINMDNQSTSVFYHMAHQ